MIIGLKSVGAMEVVLVPKRVVGGEKRNSNSCTLADTTSITLFTLAYLLPKTQCNGRNTTYSVSAEL
jgi:hypothetical protein